MMVLNRNLLFQGSIFRCYVSFREGRDYEIALNDDGVMRKLFSNQQTGCGDLFFPSSSLVPHRLTFMWTLHCKRRQQGVWGVGLVVWGGLVVGSFGWEVVLFTMLEYCFPLSRNLECVDPCAVCVGWVLNSEPNQKYLHPWWKTGCFTRWKLVVSWNSWAQKTT